MDVLTKFRVEALDSLIDTCDTSSTAIFTHRMKRNQSLAKLVVSWIAIIGMDTIALLEYQNGSVVVPFILTSLSLFLVLSSRKGVIDIWYRNSTIKVEAGIYWDALSLIRNHLKNRVVMKSVPNEEKRRLVQRIKQTKIPKS